MELATMPPSLRETRDCPRTLRSSRKPTKNQLTERKLSLRRKNPRWGAINRSHERTRWELIQPTCCPTERTVSKAQKVFNTPELLEMILLHLHARDVLAVQQVDTIMCAHIKSSSKIQRYIGLLPDASAYFHTQFAPFEISEPSIICEPDFKTQRDYLPFTEWWLSPEKNEIIISVSLSRGLHALDGLGKACRSMLICQPPIMEMDIFIDCCHPMFPLSQGPPKEWLPDPIRRASGITIGDIVEIALTLRDKHKFCPWAPYWTHNDDGTVPVLLTFRGALRLKEGDPALGGQRKAIATAKSRKAKERTMEAYCSAKLRGELLISY